MKSKNHFTIYLITGVILILSWFVAYKYSQENKMLRSSMPYLLHGEAIENFDLVDMNAAELDKSVLKKDVVSVIFIFERPCSPCDKNVTFYKKMVTILKARKNVAFYGIVLDSIDEAASFAEQSRLPFNVYVPRDLDGFMKTMRVKLNLGQTIIYTDKLNYIKLGQLSPKEMVKIIELVKSLS